VPSSLDVGDQDAVRGSAVGSGDVRRSAVPFRLCAHVVRVFLDRWNGLTWQGGTRDDVTNPVFVAISTISESAAWKRTES
jgi:hypothetical protein